MDAWVSSPLAGPAARPAPRPAAGPRLWAVASGKGGVGKSVLCSSLAIGLAQEGRTAVAVDLDFGGANLHTLFGCERAYHTLGDVLRPGGPSLDRALAATSAPRVALLSGARAPLDSGSPLGARWPRLLCALRRLEAGHVLLDLGAGSGLHTLDAFVAADRRILVLTPERTALENAHHFLKAAFFRSLRPLAGDPRHRRALEGVLDEARRRGATPRELADAAGALDPALGERLRTAAGAFQVLAVVNRVERSGARDPARALVADARERLGLDLRLVASLPLDSSVPAAVERGVPVLQLFPASPFSTRLRALAERLEEEEGVSGSDAEPLPAHSPALPLVLHDGLVLPDFDGTSPGRYLRTCRELRGISTAQLAERTRIRHLAALEAERFDLLPPEVYVRSHALQLGRLLRVPEPERLAERFAALARQHARPAPRAPAWLRWWREAG